MDNPAIGLAHFVIFWAFLFYAASFAWNLLRGLLPFLPVPYADAFVWVTVPMVLLSAATLVALAGAAFAGTCSRRRAWSSREMPR